MREIKFRVYGTDSLGAMKRMVYPRDLQETGLRAEFKDTIIMQYTGLKDKNGKEIYEGDIVCYTTNSLAEYIHCMETGNYEVHWKPGGFFLTNLFPLYKGDHNCEIIGNIHENPELIEKK